jgi:hypothetical protein
VLIFEKKTTLEMVPSTMTLEEAQARHPGKQIELAPYSSENSSLIETTLDLMVGSRTRWIAPGNDNYGFAQFVYDNKQEFIDKLGVGRWYGEWAGPGINSGEGLAEKTFILFDIHKLGENRPLPPRTVPVPLLYKGPFEQEAIETALQDLKTNGSKLVPGFMRPEGVVIHLLGANIRYKKVFEAEESAWQRPSGVKAPKVQGIHCWVSQNTAGHLPCVHR